MNGPPYRDPKVDILSVSVTDPENNFVMQRKTKTCI